MSDKTIFRWQRAMSQSMLWPGRARKRRQKCALRVHSAPHTSVAPSDSGAKMSHSDTSNVNGAESSRRRSRVAPHSLLHEHRIFWCRERASVAANERRLARADADAGVFDEHHLRLAGRAARRDRECIRAVVHLRRRTREFRYYDFSLH